MNIIKWKGMIVCLIISFMACNSNEIDNDVTKNIPAQIQRDFREKHGKSKITSFHNFSSGTQELNYVTTDNHPASDYYVNEIWKLSITEINDIQFLPEIVRESFKKTSFTSARIDRIEHIERSEFAHSLYCFHFQFPRKGTSNVFHQVLMNEDGKLLHTFTYRLNNQRAFIHIAPKELNFIINRYKNADIRAFCNDCGYNTYFFIHNDTLKQSSFHNNNDNIAQWKTTQYELAPTTPLPSNITNWIQRNDPTFHHTKIIYIESPTGNAYNLTDENSDNDRGYILGEKID